MDNFDNKLVPVKEYFNGNEFPASVWLRKYAFDEEKTPRDMFIRFAKEFGQIEFDWIKRIYGDKKFIDVNKLSDYGRKRYDKLAYFIEPSNYEYHYFQLFNEFKKIILGGSVMQGLGLDNYSSLSNCFVFGRPVDSYAGIVMKELEIMEASKRRGGCGIDVSSIRPETSPVNNQSKISNGPLLFVDRYNHGIREVSQNGRRGALMISMHIKHPDSEKFIVSKQDLTRFTGCNISIQVDNEFMECVNNDATYLQTFPIDFDKTKIKDYDKHLDFGIDLMRKIQFDNNIPLDELIPTEFVMQDDTKQTVYIRRINAKKLWNTIIHCAWKTGEPGIIFVDNHYNYSPDSVYPQYKQITTNPCFHPDTKILTTSGYHKIGDLMGEPKMYWNGKEWSEATVQITGTNEMMYKVTLSDGTDMLVTGYHVWPTTKGNKTTLDLMQSEDIDSENGKFKLQAFELPVVSYGHYAIDHEKYQALGESYLPIENCNETIDNLENYNLLIDTHLDNRVSFISGVINKWFTDGNKCIEITTCLNKIPRLKHLKLILSTLGIVSYIENNKETVSLVIDDYYCQKLFNLGVRYDALFDEKYHQKQMLIDEYKKPMRPIYIDSIEEDSITEKVFCLTEKRRNMICVEGIVTGNCGEIFMQPYDSCRLMALNLSSYISKPYTENASFDSEKFYEDCYEQLWTGNMLVELEIKYIQKIIDKVNSGTEPSEYKDSELNLWKKIQTTAKQGRRCGCGFLALGDMLAMMNLSYGSEESLFFVDKVMSIKLKAELNASIDLSIIDKPFDGYNYDKEYVNQKGTNQFYQFLLDTYPDEVERMKLYGRANISWNTVAPTGTQSILTQTTSGIEPCFLPMYKRRKKCITSDERIDFTDIDGQNFSEFYVLHEGFKNWLRTNIDNEKIVPIITDIDITNIDSVPKFIMDSWVNQSPYGNSCANDIVPINRIELQSIVQKYTSHSISSTVNLDKSASEEDVKFIYDNAWNHGLKGITVYRDGSRQGVMVSAENKTTETNKFIGEEFESNRAPKRSKRLKAHYYTIDYRKKTYSVIVGLYLNKPYEIFICSDVDDLPQILDNEFIEGELVKESKNWYYFENEFVLVKDIQDCQGMEKLTSLMISGLLRHRTPLQFVIKMIQKSEPFVGTVNFKLCKILGKYVNDGTEDGTTCPECKEHLRFEGGCIICPNCGYSKC